ncbi:MAG TPA: F0F1 ATP synthase subunit A [Thermoleophilia bacterium]|nr:F0F1 ATP synthase subunit A [Thermoleophilia bacterium]
MARSAGAPSPGQYPEASRRKPKAPRWLALAYAVIAVVAVLALFLLPGGVEQEFEVASEFELHPVMELPAIGPVDLSVTKGVIYLWITTAVVIVFSVVVARILHTRPSRLQSLLELLYGLAHDGITGSVMRTGASVWFPYIGGAFFFVLTANLIAWVPLPFGEEHQLSFYAVTGNLNVTIALAVCTFVFTHYAGIRAKGAVGYVRGWVLPSAPPGLRELIFFMHIISEIFRLVSLSVRLFANMLAGHAILAVFFAMALVFQNYAIAVMLQGGSVVLYMFELFVAFIQAFIFAILSAVYIGGALEEEH